MSKTKKGNIFIPVAPAGRATRQNSTGPQYIKSALLFMSRKGHCGVCGVEFVLHAQKRQQKTSSKKNNHPRSVSLAIWVMGGNDVERKATENLEHGEIEDPLQTKRLEPRAERFIIIETLHFAISF